MNKIEYADIIQCGQIDARALTVGWRKEDPQGIGGVINVAHNIVPQMVYNPWLPVLHHPYLDQETPPVEWFAPVLAFYDWARTKGKVIIHCQAGGNRSRGTFGVLLVGRHGMTAAEALAITGQPGYHHWRIAIENFAKHLGR